MGIGRWGALAVAPIPFISCAALLYCTLGGRLYRVIDNCAMNQLCISHDQNGHVKVPI